MYNSVPALHAYLIGVNISVDTLEQYIQSDGYQLQGFPFVNNSVKMFSIKAALTVEQGSVCALVFLDRNKKPVAISTPIR